MSVLSPMREVAADEAEGFRREAGAALGATQVVLGLIVVLGGVAVGRYLGEAVQLHSLPWAIARAMGITSLVTLTGLVLWGMWIRHPWRRHLHLRPALVTRIHVSLAAATVVSALGHAVAIAVDPYVAVGWLGALLPFAAGYRSSAVALGVLALYGLLVVGLTARMAGSRIGSSWRRIHRYALVVFWVAWLHGLTVGTDSLALAWVYVAAGSLVVATWVSKRVAGSSLVVERSR